MTNVAGTDETLSIAEMVRVLDVASEVRRTESLLERQWSNDAVRSDLRERLLATSEMTGEGLTQEQVDAAIDWYYDRLHRFRQPKKSASYYLAHLYVRRRRFSVWLFATALTIWLVWFLSSWTFGDRAADPNAVNKSFIEQVSDVETLMKLDDPRVPIKRWKRLAQGGAVTDRTKAEVEEIHDTLKRQYGIVITDWFPERRDVGIAWQPYPETPGMENGRYVLMEVESEEQGRGIEVTDAITNKRREVRVWCQAIPESARDRYQVHASRYFAYKYPGLLDLEIVLEGSQGEPLRVGPQLHVDATSTRSRL